MINIERGRYVQDNNQSQEGDLDQSPQEQLGQNQPQGTLVDQSQPQDYTQQPTPVENQEPLVQPQSSVAVQSQSQSQPQPPTVIQPLSQPQSPTAAPVYQQGQPKKKKTGLIIGIVLGSIGLMIIIAGLLLYFLWWQNPKKVLADAVIGAVVADSSSFKGQLDMNSEDTNVRVSYSGNNQRGDHDITANVRIEADGLKSSIDIKLDGVVKDNNTLYFRAKDLDKMLDGAIEAYLSAHRESDGLTSSMEAELRQYMKKQVEPFIDKINDQWIRVSPGDISEDPESEIKCATEVTKNLYEQSAKRKELIEVYRKYDFLVIKSRSSRKGGSVGYEIDLSSQDAQDKFKDFSKAMEETEIAKEVRGCSKSTKTNSAGSDEYSSNKIKDSLKLVIWVNPWTHKLQSLGAEYKDKDSGIKYTLNQEFSIGKGNEVKEPSDYKTYKDLMREWQETSNTSTSLPYVQL